MFKVRQPYHQPTNFKFSSNLAGKVYNNNRFLNSCAYLDAQIKLSTSGSDEDHQKFHAQKRVSAVEVTHKEILNLSRRKYAQSATDHHENRNSSAFEHSLRKLPASTHTKEPINVKIELIPQKLQKKRSDIVETTAMFATQFISSRKTLRKKSLKRKHAFNPHVDPYFSPYVYIRIIDKIKNLNEVEQKSIKVNFQKIYKRLIKTQLMGDFTVNFMESIQRYLREIVESHEMYINPFDIELQPELKSISRKEDFLEKLTQLWGQGQTLKIHELVKYYCIPTQETSSKILEELIRDLVIEIYEKKSCNRDIEYILMNQKGEQITHISQIFFSTLHLLIAPKETAQKNYLQYHNLIEQHNKSLKMTMRQSIRHSFVEKIVKKNIDENNVNYHEDRHRYSQQRKVAIEHATRIIQSKSKTRLQSRKQKNQIETNLDKFIQEKQPTTKNDELFTNYVLRKRKQRKQYCQILQKLRKILDPNHVYEIKSKLHDSTEQQFRKLRLFNDKYDITYNYNKDNGNKIFLINMIENCDIFNKKNTEQLQKLLNMLQIIYGKGMDNINEIFYWQFQEIYETAHGVAAQDVIMKFVLNYLTFDDYGELKKEDFFQIMDICLSTAGRSQRIIKFIIWNYLQKMSLIENNVLRKQNLEVWYEPIKIVYMLLLSIIFGSEYESIEQMLNDLFKYDYQ